MIVAQSAYRASLAASKLGLGRGQYRTALHPVDLTGVSAKDMIVATGPRQIARGQELMFLDMIELVKRRAKLDRAEVPTVET